MATTVFGLLTPRSQKTPAGCRKLFEVIAEFAPKLVPQKFDIEEPIARPFNLDRLEDVIGVWRNGVFWAGKRPTALGRYWAGADYGLHDAVYISVDTSSFDGAGLLPLLDAMSHALGADIAYVHRVHAQELGDLDYYKRHVMPFGQGLTTHDLRNGLPGLCWATYFGTVYSELFGDKLSTVPVTTHRFRSGTCIQLTESIFSPEDDYGEFLRCKHDVMEHLNSGVFLGKGSDRPTVPDFKI